jgi:hypothetical protein
MMNPEKSHKMTGSQTAPISRPASGPRLKVVSSRVYVKNGRLVREFFIDGSGEFGRGFGYKMICGA